ncbi:hypothetical protein DL766_005422 [Monosporascus sp. MC13-8B]|uniref:lytic cellulose monooxygenase (C4-dehydrogenating) n=1 Tax=Monosporascus cannonballus TaxID=155416 RepID=A0ABY0GWA4_9PEZI|nr:hypothetical protein DL762_008389 [Monosporascus cannonballus]RYO96984.1 hypothetical protein DL763_002921 [Monosporascus cannonballus]RYP29365.1 hypothetical protein DL766_005422 [Monosporascus sp. MC13-8B]
MANFRTSMLVAALASAATVSAHGHVTNVVVNGVSYEGYDPFSFPYMSSPPTVAGWTASNTDNGFVEPNSFADPDIICHKTATPGGAHIQVAAGDSISLQWDTWPESHKGPMIDYLAACDGTCESVDKTSLEFFKIDGAGYDAATKTWASDVLIENGFSWLVKIPENIAPGNYVLRHETIALHSAGQENGAQSYPQCINLQITGSGTAKPSGVRGTELYKPQDAGILVNIYNGLSDYEVPGPALIEGAVSSVAQSTSAITATGTATVGGGNGGDAPAPTSAVVEPTSAAPAPTSAPEPPVEEPTSAAPTPTSEPEPPVEEPTSQEPTSQAPSTMITATRPSGAPTTTAAPTTAAPTTAAPTSAPTGGVGAQTLYGQCGGINWTGPTTCAEGTCKEWNPYYSQCVNSA